jgi:hypothetical protein
VIAFLPVSTDLYREAIHHPAMDALLKGRLLALGRTAQFHAVVPRCVKVLFAVEVHGRICAALAATDARTAEIDIVWFNVVELQNVSFAPAERAWFQFAHGVRTPACSSARSWGER